MDANNYTGPIKPGYFKFRELAHTQDQATIPGNLRAQGAQEDSTVATKTRRTYYDSAKKQELLIDWVRANPRKKTTTEELAKILGFKAGSTAWRLVYSMEKAGKIRWVGNQKNHYLVIAEPALQLPRGNSKNGPVFVKKLEPVEPPEPPEPVIEKTVENRTPRLAADQVVVDQLNALVWRYLKEVGAAPVEGSLNNHTTLSVGLVQNLVNFTTWVDKLSGDR